MSPVLKRILATAIAGALSFGAALGVGQHRRQAAIRAWLDTEETAAGNALASFESAFREAEKGSGRVVFTVSGPCSPKARAVLSPEFEQVLSELKFDSDRWLEELRATGLCEQSGDGPVIISAAPESVPAAATLWLRDRKVSRLVVVSLEREIPGNGHLAWILDRSGRRLWSSEPERPTETAMHDGGLTSDVLAIVAREAFRPGVREGLHAEERALLYYGRLRERWTWVSVRHRPSALAREGHDLLQLLWLAGAATATAFAVASSIGRARAGERP